MECPLCGNKTKVQNTTPIGLMTLRLRICKNPKCQSFFYTEETPVKNQEFESASEQAGK